jgi:hypothetical protein
MREALIICPQHDNDGKSLQHVKHYAELALCKAFGGCTVSSAKGSWVDPQGNLISEPVWQLVAACDASADNARKLESVARYIGTEGKQQAVYLRYPSGDVQILDTHEAIAA